MLAGTAIVLVGLSLGLVVVAAVPLSAYYRLLAGGVSLIVLGVGLVVFNQPLTEHAAGLAQRYSHDAIVTIWILSGLAIGLFGLATMMVLAPWAHARLTMPR
jgi:hypothetical protein